MSSKFYQLSSRTRIKGTSLQGGLPDHLARRRYIYENGINFQCKFRLKNKFFVQNQHFGYESKVWSKIETLFKIEIFGFLFMKNQIFLIRK